MGDSIGEIAEQDQHFLIKGMSHNVIEIITEQMTYYGPILIFTFGFFGCFGNFLTFTSPRLRKNPCAFYFLSGTIFEFLSLSFGLTTRFAADQYGYDWHHRSSVFCKIRAYLVSSIPLICTYLLLLSSIDRYMSSSMIVARRTFSEIRLAHRLALFVIVLGLLSCSHILLTYDLRPKCSTLHGSYALFDGMFVVFWLGLIPHGLMISFAWMTLNNLRQRRIRIPSHRQQKIDQHLIMMLVQVTISSILVLTRMIYYAYFILGPPLIGPKRKIGAFLMSTTTLLYYLNHAKSFYIYTLSSDLFRSIFYERLFRIRKKR